MKKALAISLIFVFTLIMCSCSAGQSTSETNSAPSSSDTAVSAPDESISSPSAESGTENTRPEKLYILGDSYSAFEGYSPEDSGSWYSNGGNGKSDVTDSSQMWWRLFMDENNMLLQKNNSVSGTTLCNTGYGGAHTPDFSFIGRFDADVTNGEFQNSLPDKLIIFGGTNDSWADSPIGELKWDIFSDEDLKSVLPAFCYLLLRIENTLPNTEIITVINTDIKSEITRGIIAACNERDVKYVQLYGISKQNGHPDIEGMKQISAQISAVLG